MRTRTMTTKCIEFAEQVQPQNGQILNHCLAVSLRPATRKEQRLNPQAARQGVNNQILGVDSAGRLYLYSLPNTEEN
jgi:hypothetical protein